MTPEGTEETSPLSKADILHAFPNDDEAGDRLERGELPVVLTRGRSALISRDVASAPPPPGAASGPAAAPASASGAGVLAPRVAKLSGFMLIKRRVEYAVVDQ